MEEGELLMLIDTFLEDCVMMDRTTQPDGIGGFTHVWKQGAAFQAAIVIKAAPQVVIADKTTIAQVYTVTFPKDLPIGFHDVFKRVSDGVYFRATTEAHDVQTPSVATFQFAQVDAERWELV